MNWMIAGSGITHSERFEQARREGGRIHAIQSWVALPDGDEETAPAFSHHEGSDLPVHNDGGVWMRLLAGEAFGLRSAVGFGTRHDTVQARLAHNVNRPF